MDDLVERVLGLHITGPLPLPEGVQPDQIWDVPVGTLWRPAVGDGEPVWSDSVQPLPVACPECGNTSDLHLVGRWTEPAVCHCPVCQHSWSLMPSSPEAETTLMQSAISAAVRAHGAPR